MASFSNFKSTIVEASNTAAGITAGVTVYATRANLPTSANAGDQAYVTENNRLYIWNGNGWYNIALINLAPSIQSVLDSDGGITPFVLSTEGVVTTITITATDSDGDPITYTAEADSDFNGLATISNVNNVFTVTPFSQDSASTTAGTITFKADDGINIASSGIQTFILSFSSEFWNDVVLSIGTSSTNSLNNSTFIDRSTNAHTVTPAGTPVQTAFHPYLDNWSVEFDGSSALTAEPSGTISITADTDFCIECWIYPTNLSAVNGGIFQAGTDNSSLGFRHNTDGTLRVLANAVSTQLDSSTALENNQWYHIAATRSSGTLRIFINGTQDASTSSAVDYTDPSATNDFIVGGRYYSSAYQDEFYGYVSNLRFVVGDAVYTSGFTPSTESLADITGTELLTCQSNRFLDNSSNSIAVTVGAGNPKVSAFNPFGQDSEYVVGENKGSGYFDAVDDFLSVPNEFALTNQAFCIEAWVYPEQADFSIFNKWTPSTASGREYTLSVSSSFVVGFDMYDSGNTIRNPVSGGTLIQNAFNHVVLCRDSSNNWAIFVNGDRTASNNFSTTIRTLSGNYNVGAFNDSIKKYLKGYLSLSVYKGNTPYDPTQTSITVPTAPVGNTNASLYLPFDNAGIFDKTGLNTLTPVGNAATSATQTKFADTSLSLSGSGDGVNIGDNTDFKFLHDKTTNYTIEGWIYSFGTSGRRSILMTGAASASSGVLMEINEGLLEYTIYRGVSGSVTNINAGSINANTWYHIALSVDSNTIRFFLNGNLVNTVTWSLAGSTDVTQSASLSLGRDSLSTVVIDFSGYIENFQILKGVAKYTASFTPPISTQGKTYQAES